MSILKKITITLFLSQFFSSAFAVADSSTIKIPDVSVTKTTSNITTPSNNIVITHQQIAASGVKTLAELLATQSILQLTNASGDNSQAIISMRGFGDNAASNSLILVDGFRLANPDLSAPDLNSVLLPDIERIEIIPGSQGVLFGDQAVGGVVNIITRKPKKLTANVLVGYGSYNQNLYQFYLAGKFNNGLSYQLSSSTNDTDNFRNHNEQNNKNINVRFIYDYKNGFIFTKFQRIINNLLYPGPLTAEQFHTNPQQSFNINNFRNSRTSITQAGFKHYLNFNWTWITQFAHQQTDATGYVVQPYNQSFTINNLDTRLTGDIYRQTFTIGGYLENDRYQSTGISFANHAHVKQYNIFAQDVIHLTNKLDVTLGARKAIQQNILNNNTQITSLFTNSALVTEQGLSYQIDSDWRIYLRRDGNFRFPKTNESAWVTSGTNHLDAQIGISYESGIEWQRGHKNLKLSIYQLRLNNEIAFDPTQTATQPFGANRNLGPTLRNGIIISGNYPLLRNWEINTQYSYVDAHFANGNYKNNNIPGVAKQAATIAMFYQLNDNSKIYAQQMYIGKRYASDDDANIAGKLGGYWLTNFGFNYEYKVLNVNFRINNLFNRMYSLFTNYTSRYRQSYLLSCCRPQFFINRRC